MFFSLFFPFFADISRIFGSTCFVLVNSLLYLEKALLKFRILHSHNCMWELFLAGFLVVSVGDNTWYYIAEILSHLLGGGISRRLCFVWLTDAIQANFERDISSYLNLNPFHT